MTTTQRNHNLHTLIETASEEQIREAVSHIADAVQTAQGFRAPLNAEGLHTAIEALLSSDQHAPAVLLSDHH